MILLVLVVTLNGRSRDSVDPQLLNLQKTQWNFRSTRSPIDSGRHKAKSLCRYFLVRFAREQAPVWPK